MTLPDDWISEEEYGYSPSRYELGKYNTECQLCGSEITRSGGRSGGVTRCRGCGVVIHMF